MHFSFGSSGGNSTSNLHQGASVFQFFFFFPLTRLWWLLQHSAGNRFWSWEDLRSDAEDRLHGSISSIACSLQKHLQTRLTMSASKSGPPQNISLSRDIVSHSTFYLRMSKNRHWKYILWKCSGRKICSAWLISFGFLQHYNTVLTLYMACGKINWNYIKMTLNNTKVPQLY